MISLTQCHARSPFSAYTVITRLVEPQSSKFQQGVQDFTYVEGGGGGILVDLQLLLRVKDKSCSLLSSNGHDSSLQMVVKGENEFPRWDFGR